VCLTILYVEDNLLVAANVKEALEAEGWRVEVCADGNAALNKLAGAIRCDLLLLDNGLPFVSGLELALYARRLPRYRHTPIIMLSADDLQDAARGAGVDLFLKKPDEIEGLIDAVRRLLSIQ
jgi:two-component system chemotaxis response regulator CheY